MRCRHRQADHHAGRRDRQRASSGGGTGGAFAPLSGSPLTVLSYPGPVSNDTVTIDLSQAIAANEGLRTGAYSKTLTFTLSTTMP